MGCDAHVIVNGGTEAHLEMALARIEFLESRWSRFRGDSDVSQLNRFAGEVCEVSPETALMVERAIELWRLTGGLVDPLVLTAVENAGYDRTFEALASGPTAGLTTKPWMLLACTDIEISVAGDTYRVRLPAGSGFDPGGVGKGLAADLVVAELMGAGVAGACVNLGGDLRVGGTAPGGGSWVVAVDHPLEDLGLFTLDIAEGAAATSSTLRRTWKVGEDHRHHLIDPSTGLPSTTDLVQATVITANAWVAEGLAKALLLRGGPNSFDLLPDGIEAVTVDQRGVVRATGGLRRFIGGQVVPETISLQKALS
jgi:FAD:protein FMN transferase